MTLPPDATPNRRSSDPPDGSLAARWNDALKPWYGLLVAVLAIWSVVSTVALAVGFRVSTPADEVASVRQTVDSLTLRVTALEAANAESRVLTIALTRSKCLELRGNAQAEALNVLSCEKYFPRWPISDQAVGKVSTETILLSTLIRPLPLDQWPQRAPTRGPDPLLHEWRSLLVSGRNEDDTEG